MDFRFCEVTGQRRWKKVRISGVWNWKLKIYSSSLNVGLSSAAPAWTLSTWTKPSAPTTPTRRAWSWTCRPITTPPCRRCPIRPRRLLLHPSSRRRRSSSQQLTINSHCSRTLDSSLDRKKRDSKHTSLALRVAVIIASWFFFFSSSSSRICDPLRQLNWTHLDQKPGLFFFAPPLLAPTFSLLDHPRHHRRRAGSGPPTQRERKISSHWLILKWLGPSTSSWALRVDQNTSRLTLHLHKRHSVLATLCAASTEKQKNNQDRFSCVRKSSSAPEGVANVSHPSRPGAAASIKTELLPFRLTLRLTAFWTNVNASEMFDFLSFNF